MTVNLSTKVDLQKQKKQHLYNQINRKLNGLTIEPFVVKWNIKLTYKIK